MDLIDMPNKEFLEKFPLYTKFETPIPSTLHLITKPTIHLFCPECKSEQTFSIGDYNGYIGGISTRSKNPISSGKVILAEYRCAGCSRFCRYFLIKISEDCKYITKVGQWPPWDISMDRGLEK